MPAINLRYGNSGVLGLASAAAGRAEGYQNQRAQDMNFINSEADRQARLAEATQNNTLESQKLQLAGQMSQQRGSSSTNANGNGPSPFTQAIINAKQLAIQGAGDNLSPAEKLGFGAEANNPGGDFNQFNQMVQKAVQNKQGMAAKHQFLDSSKDQVDPTDLPGISAMVGDPQFGIQHVAQAVQQSAQKKQKNTETAADQQAKSDLWTKAQTILEKPEQLAPLVNDPRVSAQQLHQMASHLYQQEQQAKSQVQKTQGLTANQQLVEKRNQLATINQSIKMLQAAHKYDIDWTSSDPQMATGGEPSALEVFNHVQDLQKQAGQIQTESKQIADKAATYQVGQTIQTPKGTVKVVGHDTDGHPLVDQDMGQ